MSVQVCEGIWRTRCGHRVVVTQCDPGDYPVDGQRWTDGGHYYSDDGSFWGGGRESPNDLVSFIGLLTDSLKRAPVGRPAETESTTAVAGDVSEEPGRIIYDLEEKLKAAKERDQQSTSEVVALWQTVSEQNATIIGHQAEIDRLRTELQQTQVWRTAATDAHSQSEVQRTEMQVENERLQAEWQTEFTAAQQLRSDNERLQAEALQAQKYMSDANEKINQQSTEINRLKRNVEEFERIDEHKDSEIDHLRQLRRTNEAIIKEFRELLTHALSNK